MDLLFGDVIDWFQKRREMAKKRSKGQAKWPRRTSRAVLPKRPQKQEKTAIIAISSVSSSAELPAHISHHVVYSGKVDITPPTLILE